MPNERRDRMYLFGIYFSMFCENHIYQNLSQSYAITYKLEIHIYSQIFENWDYICDIAKKYQKTKITKSV